MKGLELLAVAAPDPPQMGQIVHLLEQVSNASGHSALSEHKRMELLHPQEEVGAVVAVGHHFVGILARSPARPGLVGYAQVSEDRARRQFALEMAVAPDADDPDSIGDALLDAAIGEVIALGGGTLRLWVAMASTLDDERALAAGFHIERNLIQMRCPLPLHPARDHRPGTPMVTRPFRPGLDEEAWLAVNNRAFASHPEQGHWDLATLLEHEKEPWFDPRGFLLLELDGRLIGSCWTKVHASSHPPLGEIYVIGVDPDFHGQGWGRALTEAGLDWLSQAGLTVGMLYVDADNRAAVSMYRSMGFIEDHVDRAYLMATAPR
jgi:mycothiol synthase